MFSSSSNEAATPLHPARFSFERRVPSLRPATAACPLSPSPEEEMAAEDKGADAMALDEKATPPEAGAVRFEIKKWNAVCM